MKIDDNDRKFNSTSHGSFIRSILSYIFYEFHFIRSVNLITKRHQNSASKYTQFNSKNRKLSSIVQYNVLIFLCVCVCMCESRNKILNIKVAVFFLVLIEWRVWYYCLTIQYTSLFKVEKMLKEHSINEPNSKKERKNHKNSSTQKYNANVRLNNLYWTWWNTEYLIAPYFDNVCVIQYLI